MPTTLLREIRITWRTLARAPGFALAAISILALGVGCVTVLGSALGRIVLAELPYRDPERLVLAGMTTPSSYRIPASPAGYRAWAGHAALEGVAAATTLDADTSSPEGTERLAGARVTASFFPLLGLAPRRGRFFGPAEDLPGAPPTAVLSHETSLRLFGAGGGLGRTLLVNDQALEVVGILPADFHPPEALGLAGAEVWLPMGGAVDWADTESFGLGVVARLAPGVARQQAEAALAAASANEDGFGVWAEDLTAVTLGGAGRSLGLLLAAVLLVYVVACANLGSLLVARWAGRRQEVGIRLALGAAPRQLVARGVGECLWIGLAGGGIGALLAAWGTDLMVAMNPTSLPRLAEIRFAGPELALAAALGLLGGVISGLVATLSALARPTRSLAGLDRAQTGAVRPTLRRVLVVAQLAGAVVLVLAGGLLAKSLARVAATDPGFEAAGLAALPVQLSPHRYATAAEQRAYAESLLAAVAGMEGVERAALVSEMPLSGRNAVTSFEIEGREKPPAEPRLMSAERQVSPDYFATVRVPLLAGRAFTAADTEGSGRVALVNRVLAERFFGGGALGKALLLGGRRHEIVGVVGGVRHDQLDAPPDLEIYTPLAQIPRRRFEVVIASALPLATLAPAVSAAATALDPRQPVGPIRSSEALLTAALAPRRQPAVLLLACAAVALLLASVGLYGLVAFLVESRRLETGIRIALGAGRGQVVRPLVGEGARLALLGLAVGAAGALPAMRLLASFLYGIEPHDPWTVATVAALLTTVALAASYLPARRMLQADPTRLLRRD